MGDLVKPKDFTRGRTDVPMRFEIEVELDPRLRVRHRLRVSRGFKELRVLEERLTFDGEPVYSR